MTSSCAFKSGQNSTNHNSHNRSKRDAIAGATPAGEIGNTVQTLVVVDKTMMDRHGAQNVSVYALTLLNMVCKNLGKLEIWCVKIKKKLEIWCVKNNEKLVVLILNSSKELSE